MLQRLSIKNVALIEDLSLELNNGFNVLSGETGAGKSIIIDSLNLVLGERADKELVRTGTQKARVEGIFSLEQESTLMPLLEDFGIDIGDEQLIIVREITAEGKSTCRVNGCTVTLQMLKKIADKLADIHGQHEHQFLLDVENHISFLDSFGGNEIASRSDDVKKAYGEYKECLRKLNGDWGTDEERAERAELLEFQIDEIEKADIKIGEKDELKERANYLNNAEKIRDILKECAGLINGDALDNIRSASSVLAKISDVQSSYATLYERLDSAFYELDDIASELQNESESVESDAYELEKIEDRLTEIKKLERKFGGSEEEILKYLESANDELERLRNAKQTITALKEQSKKLEDKYTSEAALLTEARKKTALEFEKRITSELCELGMKSASFSVKLEKNTTYSASGVDSVEFLFSANTGEPLKPLSKIISGGEMSRFMLAIKSVSADDIMLPTMVFDEIDTGISGQGALVVAQKIAKLARKHQVIAITHLPQLASMADEHFLIKKLSNGDRTHTEVKLMDYNERLDEIARLAGGAGTLLAQKRAEEILKEAEHYKSII